MGEFTQLAAKQSSQEEKPKRLVKPNKLVQRDEHKLLVNFISFFKQSFDSFSLLFAGSLIDSLTSLIDLSKSSVLSSVSHTFVIS